MVSKYCLRYVVLAGIFLIPFIPFVVTGSMFFPFITGKNFAFRIIIELMFAAWIVLALLDAQYRPRWSYILGGLGAFIAAIFVADLFSDNMFKALWSNFERMEGFVTLAHLFVYFVISISVLGSQKLWFAFWNTSVGVNAILGIIGLRELGESAGLIDASFGNPTYFAIYSVFHIFIACILMLRYKEKGTYFVYSLYSIVILLNIVVLYFTNTRGAILGFLGGTFLAGLMIAVFEREHKVLRKIAAGAVALVLAIAGGFYLVKDTEFVQQSPNLIRFASMSMGGGTVESRFMIWDMAWKGAQERPLFGWGQEGFSFVFAKHYNPAMYEHEPWFDRTHNIIFDWLIAGGFIGAILYFSIPVIVLYYLWIYRQKDHPMEVTEWALWTGLLSDYFFYNLFVFDNLTSYLLYIAVLGYIHARVTEYEVPILGTKKFDQSTVRIVVAPVILVLVLTFVYLANIRGIATAQNLVQALRPQEAGASRTLDLYEKALKPDFIGRQEVREQFLQMATRIEHSGESSEFKQLFSNRARESMEEHLDRVPNDTRTQLFMGSFLGSIGATRNDRTLQEDALVYLERARELSPTKQTTLFELGSRNLQLGNHEKALALFKEAFELEERNGEARTLYALAAIHAGNIELAEELLLDKHGTIAIDDNRFLQAFNSRGMHDQVIEILEKRVEKDSGNVQAYVSLAAGYLNSGDQESAIENIEEAIAVDPNFRAQGEKFIQDIRSGNVQQ